jgi:hypothetical protein
MCFTLLPLPVQIGPLSFGGAGVARATSTISAFYYQKQLIFNTSATGANVASAQVNFPICVHVNSSSWSNTTENANFFCAANVGGKRVQFFDSDQTTNLDYEVELYSATGNTSTNEAVYWIRVPSVAGNSTTDSIWVGYGNDPNGANQDNSATVWDSSTAAVWHLGDNSWGTSPEAKDSTTNANHGTNTGTDSITGVIRLGRDFNTATDNLSIGNPSSLNFASDCTFSGWVYRHGNAAYQTIFSKRGLNGILQYAFYIGSDNKLGMSAYDGAHWEGDTGSAVVTQNAWVYCTVAFNNTTKHKLFYLNGVLDEDVTGVHSISTSSLTLMIGKNNDASYPEPFDGYLDEVKIDTTVRTADWVKLEYYSMKKTNFNGDNGVSAPFLSWGAAITNLSISTLAATSITATSATLNGNVTSLAGYGNVTQYGFGWDTVSHPINPGNVTPANCGYAGNWTSGTVNYGAPQAFDSGSNVTGLSKGICYYFRAAGYSTYGWVYGDELTFPTLSDAPTGCAVTSYTSFSVSWSWTNGAGYGNSTWRYKTGSYPTSTTDGTSAYLGNLTSAQVTGLAANTIYYLTGWSLAYCNGVTSTSTGNCSFTQTTRVAQIVTLDLQVSASSDDVSVGCDAGTTWGLSGAGLTDTGIYPGYYISAARKIGGGMLFRNVTIPDGAIILTAWLELKCNDAISAVVIKTKIVGDLPVNGNSSTFSTALDYEQRRGIAGYAGNRTGNETTWDGIPAWYLDWWYHSPEIKNIVQEQIENPNWASGNSLAYFWDDHDARGDQVNDHQRAIYTWDNANPTTLAPKLHIEYLVAEPVNIFSQSSTTLVGTQLNRAVLLASGDRYIASSTITTDGPITIYAADSNWTKGAQVGNASDFHTFEAMGGVEYSSLGSPLGANIILFWGRDDASNGFVATYNLENGTWTHASTNECSWIGDLLYRSGDEHFYINTSLMADTWGDYFNKFAYSTLANILTPANWVTINLPEWGAPSRGGIQYEEPKAVIFGTYPNDNMYIMQQDDYTYYWRLMKWDFTVEATPIMGDGHFTLLESSTNAGISRPLDLISLIGSNDSMVAVGLPYSTPYPQWRIKYSTDGITWNLVSTLSVLGYRNDTRSGDGSENFCCVIPYGSNTIFVQIIAEGATSGYSAVFDVTSGNLVGYFPGTLGYPGDCHAYFVTDGTKLVIGEQNWLGDARLTIYSMPGDISNTPSSWSVGVVQPSSTYWANGGEPGWPLSTNDCWGNLTNNSAFAINVLASMTNMIGGTTWSIGSSPGTNVFTLKIGIAGLAGVGNFTTLSNTPVAWITSMAAGNMTRWTFVFYSPTGTSYSDPAEHSGNITLAAEAS